MFVKFSEVKVGEFFGMLYQGDIDLFLKTGSNSIISVDRESYDGDRMIVYKEKELDCNDEYYNALILEEKYRDLLLIKVPDNVVFIDEDGNPCLKSK
jgi:hypothetical protein